jgi:hypothetical protein
MAELKRINKLKNGEPALFESAQGATPFTAEGRQLLADQAFRELAND